MTINGERIKLLAMKSNEINLGTFGFLCGMCDVEELPGSFILQVLKALGLSTAGARSYLNRALKRGSIVSHATDGGTSYAMTGDYLAKFRLINRSFDRGPDWHNGFHTVIYNIPESQRGQRDALRASAFAQGWGSPRPGVLIGTTPPGTWAQDHITGWLEVDLETARSLVKSSWPLEQCATEIITSATRLSQLIAEHPATPKLGSPSALAAASDQTLLERTILGYRIFLGPISLGQTLPDVPTILLPADFPHKELELIGNLANSTLMIHSCQAAIELLKRHYLP